MDNSKQPAYPVSPECVEGDQGFTKLERVALQLLPNAIPVALNAMHPQKIEQAVRDAYQVAEVFLAVPKTYAQQIQKLEEKVRESEALLYQAADTLRYLKQPGECWALDDIARDKLRATIESVTAELERREGRDHG